MVENVIRRSVAAVTRSASGISRSCIGRARSAELHGKFATIAPRRDRGEQGHLLFRRRSSSPAFVPLFTMSGIEGHIFGPMAKTYAYAIAGGSAGDLHRDAGALRADPARPGKRDVTRCSSEALHRVYQPVVRFALANRIVSLGTALTPVPRLRHLGRARYMGLEFLPKLEEGNLWIRATLPPRFRWKRSTPRSTGCARIFTTFRRSSGRLPTWAAR